IVLFRKVSRLACAYHARRSAVKAGTRNRSLAALGMTGRGSAATAAIPRSEAAPVIPRSEATRNLLSSVTFHVSLVTVAVSGLLFAGCRRDHGPSPQPTPVAAAVASPPIESADVAARTRRAEGTSPPVIWLALDGLDWEILDRLSGEGKMPNWS